MQTRQNFNIFFKFKIAEAHNALFFRITEFEFFNRQILNLLIVKLLKLYLALWIFLFIVIVIRFGLTVFWRIIFFFIIKRTLLIWIIAGLKKWIITNINHIIKLIIILGWTYDYIPESFSYNLGLSAWIIYVYIEIHQININLIYI